MKFQIVFLSDQLWIKNTFQILLNIREKEIILKSMVLEKTLESALDYKEIQPVHPKGNQS